MIELGALVGFYQEASCLDIISIEYGTSIGKSGTIISVGRVPEGLERVCFS
jgi:hypothetical protein